MAQRICSVEDCPEAVLARGWCNRHYRKWLAYGDPLGCAPPLPETCEVPGCDGKRESRGRCSAHYQQWRKENVPRAACAYPDCGKPVDSHGLCAGHAHLFRAGKELRPLRPERSDTCTVPGCPDPHQGLGYCNRHYIMFRLYGDPEHVRVAPRKYTLDQSFFDVIDTEAKAYWLGFITADGNVTQTEHTNTLRVGLAIRDTAHLECMSADLGSNRPLAFRLDRKPLAVIAAFDSLQLVQGLRRLGVHPNKSGTVEPWDGPAELMSHYWRGLFDGDGSISRARDRAVWSISIAGSEPCVRAFAAWAVGVCGSTGKPRLATGRTWTWVVGGAGKPRLVAQALYGDAAVYLDRKRERACQLIATEFPGKHLFGSPG
jgi:hypothetical protein